MKWVKLIVIILGALVGAFLILCGVWLWLLYASHGEAPVLPIAIIVVGVVIFLCALILRRQIARPIQIVGKSLWATKYRRWGLIFSMVTIVVVGMLLVVQARYRETLNVLQYNGHAWSRMSTDTSEHLTDSYLFKETPWP